MDIQDIRSFVAVADHGGFRAAAEELHISQPSLSRRVHRLESKLGLKLLERDPRGVRLTEHGISFMHGARRILDLMRDVQSSVTDRWDHVIRLGCAATASGSFLARFLATWIPRHPHVNLRMIEDGAKALRHRLENRECDLAIIAAPVPPAFDHHLVKEVRLQALFPPGHRLAARKGPVCVTELDEEPVLLNAPAFLSTTLLIAAARVAGVEPQVIYQSSVGQTLAALAEAGLGIAIMGDSVDLRGFRLKRRFVCDQDGKPLSFNLHIAWVRERILSPVAYQLAEDLARHVDSGDAGAKADT